MPPMKWFDQSQPQTLQLAVWLSYISAGYALLGLLGGRGSATIITLITIAGGVGANRMANEIRWGYYLACISAVANAGVLLLLIGLFGMQASFVLTILFAVALLAGLFHPNSRHYAKVFYH